MIAHDMEWRTAEPSAVGSPAYVATDYHGVYAEVLHTSGGAWKWSVYADTTSEDADLPTDTGVADSFRDAVRAIRESID